MILQALANYYHTLAARGDISRPGWAKAKISYALHLNETGELLSILPLKTPEMRGKKEVMVPREMTVPIQFKRAGQRAPSYFLCDNPQYCLGIEKGEITDKSLRCFESFAKTHIEMLSDIDEPAAKAMVCFAKTWNPHQATTHPAVSGTLNLLKEGGNLVFMLAPGNTYMHEQNAIIKKWDTIQEDGQDEQCGICLVTGERTGIARIHNSVKGIQTKALSPNGWTLVGFDKDAFESYGKKQSYNAPVGRQAEFAYTTALNHLLSNRKNCMCVGDTTVVYWAETAEPHYQDAFSAFFGGEDNNVSSKDLHAVMQAVAQGKAMDWACVPLNPDNKFYILGLAPNAARLSVRFFLQDTFGGFVRHLQEHYTRLEIVKPVFDPFETIPLWKLLSETVRRSAQDKSPSPQMADDTVSQNTRDKPPSPQMAGDTLRAILTGGMYPATLYQQVQVRIRAERKISRGRAAIIKAYLLRNTNMEEYKEALTMELNADTTYQPYLLGRLFSMLEEIQERANPGIQATIKDKYFTSACATPMAVFPVLLNLAQKHLRKIDGFYFEKQLGELMNLITESYPPHHTLYEQGIFQLGYYHQTQKRYEKKEKTNHLEGEQTNV